MRAARIIVILIVINVLLGVLAAAVVLSPEYASVAAAVRKGKAAPAPPPEVARAVQTRAGWKRELVRREPCGAVCRARTAIILRLYSDDELLRAYVAMR